MECRHFAFCVYLSPIGVVYGNLLKGLVCMAENYSEALRKLKVAEFHSDLSAESASEDKGGRHERHERRHDIAQDYNCSQSARKKYLSVSAAACRFAECITSFTK